jgi:hypothetical protein
MRFLPAALFYIPLFLLALPGWRRMLKDWGVWR